MDSLRTGTITSIQNDAIEYEDLYRFKKDGLVLIIIHTIMYRILRSSVIQRRVDLGFHILTFP